jgi:endoglucanase
MRRFIALLTVLVWVCTGINSFANSSNIPGIPMEASPDLILINQVGFQPTAVKIALLRVQTPVFEIIDAVSGKTVFTGKPGVFRNWELSGDSVSTADFSAFTQPGLYRLSVKSQRLLSPVFRIGSDVYSSLAQASLKAFYLNRSGCAPTREFAGPWARAAGHPDTTVFIHESAASLQRPAGSRISSPGGWYDAGDYNKYVVNSGITTWTLLLFCQMYPDYIRNFSTGIPESSNGIPDVLDELLYNLRWMLSMQDPADGGVYHKLTSKSFCGFIMPDQDTDKRYVVMKSTAASLDFAATMAKASVVLSASGKEELTQLSKTCLEAAGKAYQWASANPEVFYHNPADITTGAYDDTLVGDEFFWAQTELALALQEPGLIPSGPLQQPEIKVPSWDYSGISGILSLALSNNPAFAARQKEARELLLKYTAELIQKSQTSPYRVSLDFFKWGSNSDVMNMALLKLVAYRISGNTELLKSVQGDADYGLGRNATGHCFVTGFGDKKVMHIHHRLSGADGIAEPHPGLLCGGPNLIVPDDCPDIQRSGFPAKSYSDAECSYSTNEIAINWNAPLFFVFAALDSMK